MNSLALQMNTSVYAEMANFASRKNLKRVTYNLKTVRL